MFYSIHGKVVCREAGMAAIECGGVAFRCTVSLNTLAKLPPVGESALLYTHLSVKEDDLSLFGFAEKQEMECFKMLISVSGIGPKVAIAILSNMTPDQFILCVASGDSKTLTKTPGLGPKGAQRVVLELKDKVAKMDVGDVSLSEIAASADAGGNKGEAVSALVALGYAQSDAVRALAGRSEEEPVQELIKEGLKFLAKQV